MITDPFGLIGDILCVSLSAAVPLRILEYQSRGGPSDSDFERVRGYAEILGEKGDILQFRSKKKGETAEIFNKVADGLAVMAFCPGGVKFRELRFEAKV